MHSDDLCSPDTNNQRSQIITFLPFQGRQIIRSGGGGGVLIILYE